MHNAVVMNSLRSLNSIFNKFLSVASIAINSIMGDIENLRNSNVVGSIPFWVSVLTNIPLDPNSIPVNIGKIK